MKLKQAMRGACAVDADQQLGPERRDPQFAVAPLRAMAAAAAVVIAAVAAVSRNLLRDRRPSLYGT